MIGTFLAIAYGIFNVWAFALFCRDKRRARKGRWRTSEKALVLSSLAGPFGAFLAMRLVRHKTARWKFKVVPMVSLVHGVVIAYLLWTPFRELVNGLLV